MIATAVINNQTTMENALGMFAHEKHFFLAIYGVKNHETCS